MITLRLSLSAGEQKSARKNEQHTDKSENEPPPRAQLLRLCTVANTRQYPDLFNRPQDLGVHTNPVLQHGSRGKRKSFTKMGRMAHVTILYQNEPFLPKWAERSMC